ncbi:Probable diguanylate cyclase AdrA [Edwardsiella tarda]|nr:Probable diguanylate cyclase AdrA [Edwardsiella tarda]
MAEYSDSMLPRRSFTRLRVLYLLSLGLLLLVMLHLLSLPHYPVQRFNCFAFSLELVEYLTVLLMLVTVQFSALDRRSYWVLNGGLTLWILSGVLDLLDEIVQQPVWLGNLEDVLRAIGMVMCAWGGICTLRYLARVRVRLRYLALFDGMTELPNRCHFYSSLMSQPLPRHFSLFIIDLDHFKQINDEFGHAVGNRVLCQFGRLLHSEFVGSAFPARIGGEEFAVILESEDRAWLEARAARLLQQASIVRITEQRGLTVSIGVGIYAAGETLAYFVARVDGALYQAKGAGRNHYRWSPPP